VKVVGVVFGVLEYGESSASESEAIRGETETGEWGTHEVRVAIVQHGELAANHTSTG